MEDKIDRILLLSEDINKNIDAKSSSMSKYLHLCEKLLLPVMLGVLALSASFASNKISESQLALANQESERRKSEFKTQIQTKYIELFYNDISSSDDKKQANALHLLRLMDNDLAASFASLVGQKEGVSEGIKGEALTIKSNVERFSILSGFKIGLYFVPGDQKLPKLASELSNTLRDKGFNGKIQIYDKNTKFFNDVGFPQNNEVRFEPGVEEAQAEFLVSFLSELYPSRTFTKRKVKNRTADFISIFLK